MILLGLSIIVASFSSLGSYGRFFISDVFILVVGACGICLCLFALIGTKCYFFLRKLRLNLYRKLHIQNGLSVLNT